jgi:small conductance mechanosensitive channel
MPLHPPHRQSERVGWLTDFFDPAAISVFDALIALLIVIASFVVAHFAKKAVLAQRTRLTGLKPGTLALVARIVKWAVIALAFGIALALLGADIQPLLAAVILIGVVGVLALRGIAGNFGAAVVIQSRRTILVGHVIESHGHKGVVKDLNTRSVVIVTMDGRTVHIPNSEVLGTPLINHSETPATRSSLEVRVVQADRPLAELAALIQEAAVAADPDAARPPSVLFRSASPQTAMFELRIWHDPLDEPMARSRAVAATSAALSASGVAATVVSLMPDLPLTIPPAP